MLFFFLNDFCFRIELRKREMGFQISESRKKMKNLGTCKLDNIVFSEEESKNSGFSESRGAILKISHLGRRKNLGFSEEKLRISGYRN